MRGEFPILVNGMLPGSVMICGMLVADEAHIVTTVMRFPDVMLR